MRTIATVVVDCYDAPGLAQFWAAALETSIAFEDEEYVVLAGQPAVAFQTVPDPTPGKNRMHFDVAAEDLTAETERLVSLGASVVEHLEMRGGSWTVLADPEGNRFCLVEPFDFDKA